MHMDSGTSSIRRQIAKTLTGAVSGAYSQNKVIGNLFAGTNGHSISGTVEVEKLMGQYLAVRLGYTRLHQTYAGITAIALHPDTNREFIAISYHFSRPLGR